MKTGKMSLVIIYGILNFHQCKCLTTKLIEVIL
jgi:hypothetical protein